MKWNYSFDPFYKKAGATKLSVKSLLASARTDETKLNSSLDASKSSFSATLFSVASSMTF